MLLDTSHIGRGSVAKLGDIWDVTLSGIHISGPTIGVNTSVETLIIVVLNSLSLSASEDWATDSQDGILKLLEGNLLLCGALLDSLDELG